MHARATMFILGSDDLPAGNKDVPVSVVFKVSR